MKTIFAIVIGIFTTATAMGQCAPGIPSAGNPGCIPPGQSGSPYSQGGSEPAYQSGGTWYTRWGAIALDSSSGKAGMSTGLRSKRKASKEAVAQCVQAGGTNCEVFFSYSNECVSVVHDATAGMIYASTGRDTTIAGKAAIDKCGDSGTCKVVYKECSYAELGN